ncbi:MAG: ABC transporter substrate-binding protein [Halanaeroarchaeum sp.]
MSRRKYLATTGAGVAGLVGLAGCSSSKPGSGDSGSGGSGSGTTTGTASGADAVYEAGVITAQSGSYSFLGQAGIQGSKIAAQNLEKELGVKINVTTADTETDPSTGLDRMKRLVNRDGIDFAMGGVSSSVAIKMGNWASDNGISYMATGSHSDATTGDKCAKYMYRPTTSNSMLANTLGGGMADFADSWFLMYADYTWGHTGRDAIKKALKENGGTVAGEVATPFPSSDYNQYLNQAKSSGADGLAVIIAGTDQRTVTKQFVNKGMHEEMKMSGPLFEEAVFWGLGKHAASVTGLWATPWSNEVPKTDLAKKVIDQITSQYDTSPFSRHYMGYMAMDQLVRAAHRAGSTDAADIQDELKGHTVEQSFKPGKSYWRKEDHQLVQPVSTVKPLAESKMQDDPYKSWYQHVGTKEGDKVVRPVTETGCKL